MRVLLSHDKTWYVILKCRLFPMKLWTKKKNRKSDANFEEFYRSFSIFALWSRFWNGTIKTMSKFVLTGELLCDQISEWTVKHTVKFGSFLVGIQQIYRIDTFTRFLSLKSSESHFCISIKYQNDEIECLLMLSIAFLFDNQIDRS